MLINNFIVVIEFLDDFDVVLCDGYVVVDSKFVINYFCLFEDNCMLFGGGESYGYKFLVDIVVIVCKLMVEIFL